MSIYEPVFFCYEKGGMFSKGFGNPTAIVDSSLQNVMLEATLVFAITFSLHHLFLKWLNQPLIISQMFSGFIIGFIPDAGLIRHGLEAQNALSMCSLGIFLFIIGVKIDLNMLRNSGKKAAVIGVVGYLFPMLALTAFGRLAVKLNWEPKAIRPWNPSFSIGSTWSVTSCINLSMFLNEYNLLNSKLGRLALSSSLISQLVMEALTSGYASLTNRETTTDMIMELAPFLSMVAYITFLVFVARPMVMRIVRKTPAGKQLSENHFALTIALAFICGLIFMLIGQRIYVGMFLFGLILPAGQPLGSTFANRIELYVGSMFVPMYISTIARYTWPLRESDMPEVKYLVPLLFVYILTKIVGVIVPALLYKFTFRDALILTLMMFTKGIYELDLLGKWNFDPTFTFAGYGVLMGAIPVITGVSNGLVKLMYNPSAMHVAYKRRTIQHAKPGTELRVLACTHKQENVPPIINLLTAFQPTRENPLTVSTLHLMELVGSTSSMLAPYNKHNRGGSSDQTEADHIVNAFRIFEHQSLGCVCLDPFVSMCPYASIHDDICSHALDTKSSFLILPFHRTMTLEGILEPLSQAFQAININVFDYAPCSVGILIIHGSSYTNQMHYNNMVVYFLGGPDDREALALATRMASNPYVKITVVRFLLPEDWRDKWEEKLDEEMLEEFRYDTVSNERIRFCEEVVHDGEHMVNIITSMSNDFNLVIVGRRKGLDMNLSSSFSMWSEYPELGIIGDMFASADTGTTRVSSLVVQQQVKIGEINFKL